MSLPGNLVTTLPPRVVRVILQARIIHVLQLLIPLFVVCLTVQ